MKSTPDLDLHGRGQEAQLSQPEHNGVGSVEPIADISMRPPSQSTTQKQSPDISRQPSVAYESSSLPNGQITPAASVTADIPAPVQSNPSKQSNSAEEVMRDYLVGEGIKKAHFRALHPKAPKKKKTGFFASLFSKSSKD